MSKGAQAQLAEFEAAGQESLRMADGPDLAARSEADDAAGRPRDRGRRLVQGGAACVRADLRCREVDVLVTDPGIDQAQSAALADAGVRVVLA